MTPFEVAVLSMLMLFVLTNFDNLIKLGVGGTYPRWYLYAVLMLTLTTVAAAANVVFNRGVHR